MSLDAVLTRPCFHASFRPVRSVARRFAGDVSGVFRRLSSFCPVRVLFCTDFVFDDRFSLQVLPAAWVAELSGESATEHPHSSCWPSMFSLQAPLTRPKSLILARSVAPIQCTVNASAERCRDVSMVVPLYEHVPIPRNGRLHSRTPESCRSLHHASGHCWRRV